VPVESKICRVGPGDGPERERADPHRTVSEEELR
jgi:hypothetical protein